MSVDPPTLLKVVERHAENALVVSQESDLTPSALCVAASEIRHRFPELAGATVALQCSSAVNLIIRLIALDGFARDILLLPPSVSGDTLTEILARTQATFRLTDKGLIPLSNPRVENRPRGLTEWLFTTSGTSGQPKVFSHTFHSLTASFRTGSQASRLYRWGLAYQPYRFAGVQVILHSLLSGSALVVPSSQDVREQTRCFTGSHITALSATPSQWRNYLIQGGLAECKLQQITLGGEIADAAILSALARQFPAARIVHIYASTEAGVGFSVSDGKAGFPRSWLGEGPPVDMRISPTGTLLIRTAFASTSASLYHRLTPDGFLDTEDCVREQDDRVYFIGRASGIINVGGEKVYPEEIENIVREVAEVQNAVVSAKSSPVLGQLVSLEVQAQAMSQEQQRDLKRRILSHCRDRLEKYKVPALIHIVTELALVDSGKLGRKQPE